MGPLKDLFQIKDYQGCQAHVETLWAGRTTGWLFTDSDAADAAWLLACTSESPELQLQLWPKLFGLLTRWAFMIPRSPSSESSGNAGGAAILDSLTGWLAALLNTRILPWAVHAPALLLLVVASSTATGAGVLSRTHSAVRQVPDLTSVCQVLFGALARAPPPDLLLPTADAVTDLCTATGLVLEGLAVAPGQSGSCVALFESLVATLAASVAHTCHTLELNSGATGHPQRPQQGLPAAPGASADGGEVAVALMLEAAAGALAALHVMCRQLGAACSRIAVVASPVAVGQSTQAPQSPAAAAVAFLQAIAERLRAIAAAAASSAPSTATGSTYSRLIDVDWGIRPPSLRLADRSHGLSDLAAAFTATAAGGLVEGCTATLRLQAPSQQPGARRALQPCWELLTAVLQQSAGAAAREPVATADSTHLAAGAVSGMSCCPALGTVWSHHIQLGREAREVLRMAVGYCWARLRTLPPQSDTTQQAGVLPGPVLADRIVEAAMAAAVGSPRGGAPAWHPARGSLAMLLSGSLAVSGVLRMAKSGGAPTYAAEALDSHARGPLFADTQLLARAATESARLQVTPGGVPVMAQVPVSVGMASAVAEGVLIDGAAASRRLHHLYSIVADSADGRAWVASLPPAAANALRELLDRTFVCVVSVLVVAYDTLAASPTAPHPPTAAAAAEGKPHHPEGFVGAVRAAAAVTALGALADMQFCALQLRVHGDLVARLSSDLVLHAKTAAPRLVAMLPCYSAIAVGYDNGGFSAAPVTMSRLTFLLPLAASCIPHAPDTAAAATAVLPYIYLLLKGAPESVAHAVNAIWAALLDGLCNMGTDAVRLPSADRFSKGCAIWQLPATQRPSQGCEADGGISVAAAMVPFFVERSCQAPCSVGDVERLEWGLRQVLKALPLAHATKAWCVARMIQQLTEWAMDLESKAHSQPLSAAQLSRCLRYPAAHQPAPIVVPADGAALVRQCANVVALLVATVDYTLLTNSFEVLDCAVKKMSVHVRTLVAQQFHDTWLKCDDYARKRLLDGWLSTSVSATAHSVRLV